MGTISGGGTVTSVGVSTSGVLHTVSNSPVTTAGTIALNLIDQTANTVLAGPSSGGAAAPSMRALQAADMAAHASTHAPGASDDLYAQGGHAIASAVEPFSRLFVNGSFTATSGSIYFTMFTAPRAFTATSISYMTAGTAASGLTLCRLGLYTVDGSGNTTLVGATNSDTALFGSPNAVTTKALALAGDLSTAQTTYSLVRGTRYACALILVGTTMPTILRGTVGSSQIGALSPVIATSRAGQSDLTTSNTIAQAPSNATFAWCYLT